MYHMKTTPTPVFILHVRTGMRPECEKHNDLTIEKGHGLKYAIKRKATIKFIVMYLNNLFC